MGATVKFRFQPYCVEKLDSSGYSINFNKQDHCNLLFLLSDVSVETRENRRKGIFQHNKPESGNGLAMIFSSFGLIYNIHKTQ
jgi:hypothetical protein